MDRKSDQAYKLKIDLIDYNDEYDKAVTILWSQILTDNGQDWLYWYLYDKNGISGKPRKDMQAWDEDKKEICKNLKGLHSFLVESNYFRIQGKNENEKIIDSNNITEVNNLTDDKMSCIINWDLHQKLKKPTEIKTEFDFKKEPCKKKNKIKKEIITKKKSKKEEGSGEENN
jgi:hypothetical protein